MAVMTNVDMVNNVLRELDFSTVTNSDDTEESLKVWYMLKDTYEELIVRRRWDFLKTVSALTEPSDKLTSKVKLLLPEGTTSVECVNYSRESVTKEPALWTRMKFLEPCDYLDLIQARSEDRITQDYTDQIAGPNGIILYIYNNKHPEYYTRMPSEEEGSDGQVLDALWFDSYDRGDESPDHLKANASSFEGFVVPPFADDINTAKDTQQIPARVFPVLLAELKVASFLNFKQTVPPQQQAKARRLYLKLREEDRAINRARERRTYGRPRVK